MNLPHVQCPTCSHNAHAAGDCVKCNCGESEIVRSNNTRQLAPLWIYEDAYWFGYKLFTMVRSAETVGFAAFDPADHIGAIK